MARFYDEQNKNNGYRMSIDELISIFYDEAFLITNDKIQATFIAREALIDFIINNGDYGCA